MEKISRKNWALIWVLGMAGQICWNIENSWFNTFVYRKIAPDPSIVAWMVGVSAVVSTFCTFLIGTASDRLGRRRPFIAFGYILWGVFTIGFGVTEFLPLDTAHSERHVFKPARGEKVITAALKQSLKAYRPALLPLTPFREAVLSAPEGRKFIAHCAPAQSPAGKAYLARALRPGETATVFIGPEGDFSPGEIAFALANGFEEITLGRQRLRTETAALAAVVMASVVNG